MAEPKLSLAYEALVDIGERQDLGVNLQGARFMVPILGGSFEGDGLRGRVLPGGADRQWLRPDGVKELDALYEMQTDDGAIIVVRNRVLVDGDGTDARYARSVVRLQTTSERYDALNRRVFVGTVASLRPERQAVRIRVYRLD